MRCIACGNGCMQETEVGQTFVAECGSCGARISARLDSAAFEVRDRDYEREYVLV